MCMQILAFSITNEISFTFTFLLQRNLCLKCTGILTPYTIGILTVLSDLKKGRENIKEIIVITCQQIVVRHLLKINL